MRRRYLFLALATIALASATNALAAHVPGALHVPYAYNDAWTGWPVAPVDRQHPIRSSFLEPRPSGGGGSYHIGVDINVRDDRPEEGAPPGRTHRVYAIEGGAVEVPLNQASRSCSNRRVAVGHFEYWHVDTLSVVANGQTVAPGQMVGWTCNGLWHVHLSERVPRGSGEWGYVNPLHAASKIAPFVDTAPPVVRDVRFYSPATPSWTTENGVLVSADAGERLEPSALTGEVDVRVLAGDEQSFAGWFADLPALTSEHHPRRLALRVTRLWDGAVVHDRDVFVADALLNEPLFGPTIPFDFHYAPGMRQNISVARCLSLHPADCRGALWLRAFARPDGAYWDTTREWNGRYRLDVTAWDSVGNAATRSADVTIANGHPPTFTLAATTQGAGTGTVTSVPAGISCGSTCITAFPAGSTVRLSASPAARSTFVGWSGACTGTGTCDVRLGSDATVSALFEPAPAPAREIVGTPGDDVLRGTPGADIIRGRGGNDTIRGGGGSDVIHGGAGQDRLIGGAGRDTLRGGYGRDTLFAREGEADILDGGRGRDRARFDRGIDRVRSVERVL